MNPPIYKEGKDQTNCGQLEYRPFFFKFCMFGRYIGSVQIFDMVYRKNIEIGMKLILCFVFLTLAVSCVAETGVEELDSEQYIVGLVNEGMSKSIAELDHFKVVDAKGEVWVFGSFGEFDGKLTPSHLRDHMIFAERVKVFYEVLNGNLVALKVEDHN